MATFARDVTIDPIKSRPGEMPFPARGIFTDRARDVMLDDGTVVSSQELTLGIRGGDSNADGTPMWPSIPARGDKVTFQDDGRYTWVSDVSEDGQGGWVMTLRKP